MNTQKSPLRVAGFATAGMILGLTTTVSALSPPPPQPDDELLPLLYESLGGDEWVNNEGWMDPEVHWCDWYGVDCGQEFWPGYFYFDRLELPDNNLRGEMTEELAELLFDYMPPRDAIDLSGNAISGAVALYPRRTERVDLSDNDLGGPLPPLAGTWALEDDQQLLLNRNHFIGTIPQSWSQARIWMLDLSDNQLTGGLEHVFGSASEFVYLTGNPVEEELGRYVLGTSITPRGQSNLGGGIDMCYTGLTVADPVLEQWLADHHTVSADYAECLSRARSEIDATISGSWYNPDRSGEGVSLMLLDNGAPLLYSFSFDLDGNQEWLFQVGSPGPYSIAWDDMRFTSGRFGEGVAYYGGQPVLGLRGRFRLDRIGRDTVSLHRHYLAGCDNIPFLCALELQADRMDYQRLTELAGTTCDNQDWAQQFSGAWYDPGRNGEGFVLEVLPGRRVVVYWFTYEPGESNRQAWMIGSAILETPIIGTPPPGTPIAYIDFDSLQKPEGATYGDTFDTADIELVDWGSLHLEFFRDGTGRVEFDSNLPGYASGEHPIERLARPMLAECD